MVCSGLASCAKSGPPSVPAAAPVAENATGSGTENAATTVETAASGKGQVGVKAEMRNVLFRLTPTAPARLISVSGELWPTGKNEMVVFDDKKSFEVRVANGTIAVSTASLQEIMNNYVFAKPDAPLKDLTLEINPNNGRLVIKGKLHSKGDVPFGTEGTLSVNDDGRLRVHTEKITAMKVSVKKLMGLFGLELANVMDASKTPGIGTDKNDLLMDLGVLLPPPHIRGKLTGVQVRGDTIVTTFGNGGKAQAGTEEAGSYMAFSGSRVKFGTLVMDPVDLTVLDLDPKGTLDWSQDRYKEQLVAGYSKITPNFGLRTYALEFAKLGKKGAK